MLITLIKKTHISTISLPEKVHGQYWIRDYKENAAPYELMSIEARNNCWELKSNRKAAILDANGRHIKSVILEPGSFYDLEIVGELDRAVLFTEPTTSDRQVFRKFGVDDNSVLRIGRVSGNDIVFKSGVVSSDHAQLRFYKKCWLISDLGSTNGTFVNNRAITEETPIAFGDMVYIMGLKIVVGNGFLAINDPDGKCVVGGRFLHRLPKQNVEPAEEDEDEQTETTKYFYRSPRFKRDIEKATIKIDPPPNDQVGNETPFMLTIGPSITMGMASIATGSFTIYNAISSGNISGAIPSAIMSLSMLMGTMLWPIITKSYEKRRKQKREQVRQEKYTAYLNQLRKTFAEEIEKQRQILRENSVLPQDCVERIENKKRNLWERGAGQNDFLQFRLGLGSVPMQAEVTYAERKFSLDDDNLLQEMYSLCEEPKLLENVPISLSLVEHPIAGIIGERPIVTAYVKGLILQLSALYGYDEVKCVFIYDEAEKNNFSFVKWLPHVWDDDKKLRYIATNNAELKEVSAYIERVIENRQELNQAEAKESAPYFVIFALSKELSLRADMLKQLYAAKDRVNISIVACFDELKDLPKECSTVVELTGSKGKLYDKNDISGRATQFQLDTLVFQDLNPIAKQLANIILDTSSGAYKLPQTITFLEMFGVGKVEHLNSLARWKENDPTKSLEAAVGVNTLGDTFMLDLHQKYHGPHGLVAGMTGSGKSEFIITYILSLAVNYHPDEVSFILIDYKGGGMAKSFKNLPHIAGIITNLDGAAIKRSLLSIESELIRRQNIFSAASEKLGVSNIDIYKYQKLYRDGVVSEPLQHLFIISDEFAELKTQKPEFMEQLVSAARIGRSLGVHLILATQKPAGVVDDQIWSNSKFRVCLKVQDRSDSMDMLKRPDAAELSDTGRFYLQVGYNELFELGQSAWAGAPYYPSERVLSEKDDSVILVDRNGRTIKRVRTNKHPGGEAKKQLDVITDYLAGIAADEHIRIRKLWLEPIPAMILIDSLRAKYGIRKSNGFVLNPLIGEYDDPRKQRQCPLTLPLSSEGNAIIYGSAGNGKTTFLNAMIYSLITEHTPEEVNLYILDFAAETLRAFAKAPHVGDVILAHEAEKLSNLFKMLYAEMQRRKKLFSNFGGDFQAYVSSGDQAMPNIVVAINNYTAFAELFEEKEEAVSFLSREGRKYGIYFVLTAIGTGAVRFRMLQNFKQLLALQLNDEADYSVVVGKTDGLLPSGYKGRGLIRLDDVYEFQTAHITDDPVPFSYIQGCCQMLSDSWNGMTARKIPILPEQVDVAFVQEYYHKNAALKVPVGVEASSLEVHYYPFDANYISMILSADDLHADFLQATAKLIAGAEEDITILDLPKQIDVEGQSSLKYYDTVSACAKFVDDTFDTVANRHNAFKLAADSGKVPEQFKHMTILINSISSLFNSLDEQRSEKLGLILERGESKFNITILIADRAKDLTKVSYSKWYKKHITQADGLWIGDGFSEQYQLKANKTMPEARDAIGSGFGYSLRKGNMIKIKVLRDHLEEDV